MRGTNLPNRANLRAVGQCLRRPDCTVAGLPVTYESFATDELLDEA